MEKSARRLHQKAHTKIEKIEVRIRAWQIHNKPLFYTLAGISWFVSTLASGAVLDLVLPMLEVGVVVKIILWLVGICIFLLIFVLAFFQRRKRGFFFWYPWTMVFVWAAIFFCSLGRQAWVERIYTQKIAGTNDVYLNLLKSTNVFYQTSNAVLASQIDDLHRENENQKENFSERKREDDSKIQELITEKESAQSQLTFFEANPDKLTKIYNTLFASMPTNVAQYSLIFSEFGAAVSNLNEIELTAENNSKSNFEKSSEVISNQLADLGIEKLPDGHISFNGMISGAPTVITNAMSDGVKALIAGRKAEALVSFQKGIAALEATDISRFQAAPGSLGLTPEGRAQLYGSASYCAGISGSNNLAFEYAKKSFSFDSEPRFHVLITLASCALADDAAQKHDFSGAFDSIKMAITNYESLPDSRTNLLPKMVVSQMYGQGITIASILGKTNEAVGWSKKLPTP